MISFNNWLQWDFQKIKRSLHSTELATTWIWLWSCFPTEVRIVGTVAPKLKLNIDNINFRLWRERWRVWFDCCCSAWTRHPPSYCFPRSSTRPRWRWSGRLGRGNRGFKDKFTCGDGFHRCTSWISTGGMRRRCQRSPYFASFTIDVEHTANATMTLIVMFIEREPSINLQFLLFCFLHWHYCQSLSQQVSSCDTYIRWHNRQIKQNAVGMDQSNLSISHSSCWSDESYCSTCTDK